MSGSSPRERGTVANRYLVHPHGRVIPARAGNSANVQRDRWPSPGHPRESGEQKRAFRDMRFAVGSSPRERGTATTGTPTVRKSRVIPARAGNRHSTSISRRVMPGHPRESGEQFRPHDPAVSIDGSSPRERGTAIINVDGRATARVIPARAGNRLGDTAEYPVGPGHPRESGEQAHFSRKATKCSGHPRESGEQCEWQVNNAPPSGSSPRERGTAGSRFQPAGFLRVIPARAGNRRPSSSRPRHPSGHPRESGEQLIDSHETDLDFGSSPRERGTGQRSPGSHRR